MNQPGGKDRVNPAAGEDVRSTHRLYLLSAAAGGISAVLGSVVLLACCTRSIPWLPFLSASGPTPIHIGLGFLVTGAGLGALALRCWRTAAVIGVCAVTVSLLTLCGRIFGFDPGMEQFLPGHAGLVPCAHQGITGPCAAVCFLLGGGSLILSGMRPETKLGFLSQRISGAVLAAFGVAALTGIFIEVNPAQGLGWFSRMAIHEAAAFVVLGGGLLALASHDSSRGSSGAPSWIPICVGLFMAMLSIALWRTMIARDRAQLEQIIRGEASQIKLEVIDLIESRIRSLVRMARRWQIRGGTPRAEWEADAGLCVDHYPGNKAIVWVDPDLRVRWIVPGRGNEAVSDLHRAVLGRHRKVLEAARDRRRVQVARSFNLGQGNAGFLICVPLVKSGGFDGLIGGIVSVPELLDTILMEHISFGYSFAVRDERGEIYRPFLASDAHFSRWGQEIEIPFHGVAWRLRIWPSPKLLARVRSSFPDKALAAGLLLSFLFALSVHLAQTARRRAIDVESTNKQLKFQITQREHAEEQLKILNETLEQRVTRRTTALQASQADLGRQAIELSRSNEELEKFAYVASHDLKAPLRAIDNLTSWIEEDLGDVLEGDTRRNMDLLRGRVSRMERLLDDLLTYSRAGRVRSNVERVDTRALVQDVTELLNPPEGFRVDVEPGLPTLETEKAPLEQVFRNLIGNAIKHHNRPDGRVTVAVEDTGGFHDFVISDDGPGIPEKFHEKIFGMFQTLQSRDKVEGSGMGLALVKKIVERYGGRIRVESQEGQGTRFFFTWSKHPEGSVNHDEQCRDEQYCEHSAG